MGGPCGWGTRPSPAAHGPDEGSTSEATASPVGADALDSALVEKARTGSRDAFAVLYGRHYVRVLQFCHGRLGNWDDAEDAAQEAFLRARRAIARGVEVQRFGVWIQAIAANLCFDSLRRRGRTVPFVGLAVRSDRCLDDGPEEALVARDEAASASRAFERISPRFREVLRLREHAGWSYERIAHHEQLELSAVKSLLWRARQALRREYLLICAKDSLAVAVLGSSLLRWRVLRESLQRACAARLAAPLEGLAPVGASAASISVGVPLLLGLWSVAPEPAHAGRPAQLSAAPSITARFAPIAPDAARLGPRLAAPTGVPRAQRPPLVRERLQRRPHGAPAGPSRARGDPAEVAPRAMRRRVPARPPVRTAVRPRAPVRNRRAAGAGTAHVRARAVSPSTGGFRVCSPVRVRRGAAHPRRLARQPVRSRASRRSPPGAREAVPQARPGVRAPGVRHGRGTTLAPGEGHLPLARRRRWRRARRARTRPACPRPARRHPDPVNRRHPHRARPRPARRRIPEPLPARAPRRRRVRRRALPRPRGAGHGGARTARDGSRRRLSRPQLGARGFVVRPAAEKRATKASSTDGDVQVIAPRSHPASASRSVRSLASSRRSGTRTCLPWSVAAGQRAFSWRKASCQGLASTCATVRPADSTMARGVPSATRRPSASSASRSHCSASAMTCVVTSAVTPSLARSRTNRHASRRAAGSMPLVGSSSRTSSGRWTRVAASAVRWRRPVGSVPSWRPATSPSSRRSRTVRVRAGSEAPYTAAKNATFSLTVSSSYRPKAWDT